MNITPRMLLLQLEAQISLAEAGLPTVSDDYRWQAIAIARSITEELRLLVLDEEEKQAPQKPGPAPADRAATTLQDVEV